MIIRDKNGQEQDWAWLRAKFGNVTYDESDYEDAYRLVEIQEQGGHSSLVASLRDGDGNPVQGISVIRHWIGMDPKQYTLPDWTPPPERYFDTGVHGETNAEGNIGFGMGRGDLYHPDQGETGASSIWVGHWGIGSDCIHGLGWLVEDVHLNCVFQRLEQEPDPDPEPDDEWDLLFEKLDKIIKLLEDRP